ncbi:MAG: hypothetical protein J3Q66DRAFT_39501 [Benniella sp.]|nr:MAG: hypothetical protein J3Q66DRAFT_39501 [Benniella sp.]
MDKPQGQKSPFVPIVDRKVFRPLTRKEKRKLPHRKLYEVEVLDEATGTIPQVLDTLSTAGPFQVRGWIPIEDTIHTLGVGEISTKEKMVFIKAESITEWNHEFDPDNVMQPKFWVLSDRICWYQIMSIHKSYEPHFRPLSDVCAYLSMFDLGIIHRQESLKWSLPDWVSLARTLNKSLSLSFLQSSQMQSVGLDRSTRPPTTPMT